MTGCGPFSSLGSIDHIIVLMLENRSFDHLVGRLYHPDNAPPFDAVPRGQPFEGLAGKDLSNPIPPRYQKANRAAVHVGKAAAPNIPRLNPGEGYAHTNTQLYGQVIPQRNRRPPFRPPYNLPPILPDPAPMNGFVLDYINVIRNARRSPSFARYKTIMDCFAPSMVPIISTLANSYAICDQWFCSVPSQTCSNRSFALAGTSSGFVDNTPYTQWLKNDVVTIFDLIQEANRPGLTWRVYFDAADIVPLTWAIFPGLRDKLFSHFSPMGRFWQEARKGDLPSLALIEPRYIHRRNDQHPPASVTPGERLLLDVYQALRASPNWARTLLIITYDEHGGCYDHVPPPSAVPPDPTQSPGQFGFRFDRLGPRVCTVLVSPYVQAGTVFRARDQDRREAPLDHTSILKTVTTRFGLPSLTARDAAAVDLGGALTLLEPRQDTASFPLVELPQPARVNEPLGGLGRTTVEIMAANLNVTAPAVSTVEEALAFLRQGRVELARIINR